MQDTDKHAFHELMMSAGEIYGKEVTKPLLRIYYNALEDLTIKQVTHAFTMHMRCTDQNGTFFPKPADIIRQISGTNQQYQRSIEERAELAWQCILGEISRVGPYKPLTLDDGQAMAAVKGLGGWISLCKCSYDDLTWKKKEFISMYEGYENTPLEHLPKQLPGIVEIENAKKKKDSHMDGLMKGLEDWKTRNKVPALPEESTKAPKPTSKLHALEHIKNMRDILGTSSDELESGGDKA